MGLRFLIILINESENGVLGSLEGAYDAEMWGVIPRVLDFPDYDNMIASHVSFEAVANAIHRADTANWAESFDELTERVKPALKTSRIGLRKKAAAMR